MNVKWLGFLIFVWLIGVFLAATYEDSFVSEVQGGKNKIEYLLTPYERNYQGQAGNTKYWFASSNYWMTWAEVLVWDFPFLKPYDANGNGIIDAAEKNNNEFGVYAGYFMHAFGLVGLAAFLFAMFQFVQGIVPW